MALVKGQGTGSLAKELYTNLGIEAHIDSLSLSSAEKVESKQKALNDLQKMADTIIDHYVDNAEINSVQTNINSWASASNHAQGTTQTGSGNIN